jgi:hypothetical protein
MSYNLYIKEVTMINKHSPGPWKIHTMGPSKLLIRAGTQPIALMEFGYENTQNWANAKLACASPDLLNACEIALSALMDKSNEKKAKLLLLEAITKAKGWSK